MGNEQSTPQMRANSPDLEKFKAAVHSIDTEELERHREAMRQRRKIKHSTAGEWSRQGGSNSNEQDELLFVQNELTPAPDLSPSSMKQEDTSEDDRPLAGISHSRATEQPIKSIPAEDGDGDGDSEIPLASRKRQLVRSSESDPEPVQIPRSDSLQRTVDPLKDWSPRKERAEKVFVEGSTRPTLQQPQQTKRKVEQPLGNIKISKKSSASSSPLTEVQTNGQSTNAQRKNPPEWYQRLQKSKVRSKDSRLANTDAALSSLRSYVRKCESAANSTDISANFQKVRDMLHTVIFMDVTAQLLRDNLMLSNENGLPQVFDLAQSGNVHWPFDIKADALELYTKWCRKDFDTDIIRGIKTSSKTEKGGDSIDTKYPSIPWKQHGDNFLVNGQWWPIQLCTLRDGAHGAAQGGIAGARGQGAYSVVVSGGLDSEGKPYPDEDHGDWLLYCGTDSKDGLSANTAFLSENQANHKPVRLIRSHNAKSEWAPELGFRYDGLYAVTSARILDASKNRHQFHLERLPGQDPIRGGSGPEARPTEQEIKAYKEHKRLLGRA